MQTISWKEAISIHFLLFGYWLTPRTILKKVIEKKNKKIGLFAILNILICSFISAMALLGILDGQEVIVELLTFNPYIWSKMLFNYGIYSFLLLFASIIGIGFILPLILSLIINKLLPTTKRKPKWALFIASSYGILPILFYSPLIYSIGFLTLNQNPQLAQLMPEQFWNALLYAFIGFALASLPITFYGSKKMLS